MFIGFHFYVTDVTRSHSTQQLNESNKNYIEAQFADIQKSVRGNFDKNIREYKTKFQDLAEIHFRSKPTPADRAMPIPDAYVAVRQQVGARENYLDTPLTEFRKLYTSAQHTDMSPTRSMCTDEDNVSKSAFDCEHSERHDALHKMKHSKQAEQQILKQNLHKMYHSPKNNRDSAAVDQQEQQVNQSYRAGTEDGHNLRVEVESFSGINDIKSQTQDMLLVVRSSINSREVTEREEPEIFAAQMTIVVSPKRRPDSEDGERRRSPSPEQAAQLTRNDVLDAIFRADLNDETNVQMQLELGTDDEHEDSGSEAERSDWPPDAELSAERYTRSSRSASLVSVPATTDDDNFWDT